MHRLVSIPVESATPAVVERHMAAVRAALDGSGPAVLPTTGPTPDAPAEYADDDATGRVPDGVALVVTTSGSTGEPRAVMLDAAALLTSAEATHDRLDGPGRWVLALPLTHVAGIQVLVRSVASGTEPVVVERADGFDPVAVAATLAAARPPGRPLYASLVPTQLHRILAGCTDDVMPSALAPWREVDAILVGGAAAAPGLLDRARRAGLRVVTTYGMTETCGGCVYDGDPLAGVRLRTDDSVIELAGPVLARGYLGRPDLDAAAFRTVDGVRWLRTPDTGVVVDGRLRVLGRRDDVIVTGGVKVAPASVEEVLAADPGVDQVCVVAVPDDEWGQVVAAVVVPAPGAAGPTPDALRRVRDRLGPAAVPRRLAIVDALPVRGPGKVDRAAVARLAIRQARPS